MIGLALGALSFGTKAFGALSSYNNSQAAAAKQNAYNRKIYRLQIKQRRMNYAMQTAAYGNRKIQYKQQLGYNFDAAQRAYQSEQSRINELYKQMGFTEQGAAIQQAQGAGKIQAREVSGRSMDRIATLYDAGAQRNQAIRGEMFKTAVNTAAERNKRTREQLKIANDRAFWNVGQPPQPTELPPPPLAVQGQSQSQLFAGLGSAALGAFQTFSNFANYDPGAPG